MPSTHGVEALQIQTQKTLHRRADVTCRARAQKTKTAHMPPRSSLCVMQYHVRLRTCAYNSCKNTSASATEGTKNDIANCDRSNTSCCLNPRNGVEIIGKSQRLRSCHDLKIYLRKTVLSSQNIHADSSPQFKDFVHLRGITGGVCNSMRILE